MNQEIKAPAEAHGDERADFEVWGNDTFNYGFKPETWEAEAPGEYAHEGTQMAYEGWLARASRVQPKGTAQTIKLGSYGQAFDAPGDRRAYTYKHQPGNQAAWRLGDASSRVQAGGDLIDRGLSLLKVLEAGGFGVFELDEAAATQAPAPAPEDRPACNPHPKAPHGFDRNASHNAGRYVCDCEGWDAWEAGYQEGVRAALDADDAQAPAVGAEDAKDAARWRALRNHWKSCRFNFRKSPNVIKSVTLTINFDHDTGGDAKYIEHEFDAAIAAAPSISKPPVQGNGS